MYLEKNEHLPPSMTDINRAKLGDDALVKNKNDHEIKDSVMDDDNDDDTASIAFRK